MLLAVGRSLVKTSRGCEQSEDSVYLTDKTNGNWHYHAYSLPKRRVIPRGRINSRTPGRQEEFFILWPGLKYVTYSETSRIFLRIQGLFRGSKIITIKEPFEKIVTSKISINELLGCDTCVKIQPWKTQSLSLLPTLVSELDSYVGESQSWGLKVLLFGFQAYPWAGIRQKTSTSKAKRLLTVLCTKQILSLICWVELLETASPPMYLLGQMHWISWLTLYLTLLTLIETQIWKLCHWPSKSIVGWMCCCLDSQR